MLNLRSFADIKVLDLSSFKINIEILEKIFRNGRSLEELNISQGIFTEQEFTNLIGLAKKISFEDLEK